MALPAEIIETPILTYEEYLNEFWEEPPTLQPYQIIDGVREYMTSPTWLHQDVVFLLAQSLRQFGKASGRGHMVMAPFDVLIRPHPLRTRQPDVLFISQERLEQAGGKPENGPLTIAPELVIEVLSPSETRRSLNEKLQDYCSIGVLECWIVSPQGETIEVMRLSESGAESAAIYGADQESHSLIFPDLKITVNEIFNV